MRNRVSASAQARIKQAKSLQDLTHWNHKHCLGWKVCSGGTNHQLNSLRTYNQTHYSHPQFSTWEQIQDLLDQGMSIDMVAIVMSDNCSGRAYWKTQIQRRIEQGEIRA